MEMEFFAGIVPTKVDYESIVDGRETKTPSFLKMIPQEISEVALSLFFERGAKKIFYVF